MGRVLLSQVGFRAVATRGREGYLAATIYYTGDFDSSPSDKARVDPEPPVMGSRDDRERDRVVLGRGDEDRVDQTRVGVPRMPMPMPS